MSDLANLPAAREDLCRFLAACYYEPCAEFEEEKLFDSMQFAACVIDPELAASVRRLGEAFADDDLETLLVDYAQLFIGPAQPAAMPYASFWLTDDASKRHDTTMAVLDFYEQGGLDVSDDFRELPDHVTAELEFFYLLTFNENEARRDRDDERAGKLAGLKRQFLEQHLGLWVTPFVRAIGNGARTGFYRALADLTERFVQAETSRALAVARH